LGDSSFNAGPPAKVASDILPPVELNRPVNCGTMTLVKVGRHIQTIVSRRMIGKKLGFFLFWLGTVAVCADWSQAQRLDDAIQSLTRGDYAKALSLSLTALEDPTAEERWFRLAAECHLIKGEYREAFEVATQGIVVHRTSLHLRRLAAIAANFSGKSNQAADFLEEIGLLYELNKWRYRRDEDQALLAEYFLQQGRDPKEVLNTFLKPLGDASYPARMATGNLALSKSDDAMAADNFRVAAELNPDAPDPYYGLARSYESSDPKRAGEFLQTALQKNPHFAPALLRRAESAIDGENYTEAEEWLKRVLDINPSQVHALAFKAVIAHIKNDFKAEAEFRALAMSAWEANPEFDHLVGKKLSQKYRFEDGVRYQQRALVYDPNYQPAKIQLALDQLRLGDSDDGWRLAEEVYAADPYNILAHNLVSLRDRLTKYTTLSDDEFVVRMEAREAKLYGAQVLALLHEAKEILEAKFEVEIARPIFVEIYAAQHDFAVRTFGIPGVRGFLGVCFGKVVTMNSPSSQGNRAANWQAVLWHEFCHVITLQKTSNKMPRWLSEGISVYEERQRNPAWGQAMTPRFREMALADDVIPVSRLSEAFLNPATPEHLQFAYYQSSLVVEFLLEQHGPKMLNRLLVDLGLGVNANKALEHYVGSLKKLDQEFTTYLRKRAESWGTAENFVKPELSPAISPSQILDLAKQSPDNYYLQRSLASYYLNQQDWPEAIKIATRMLENLPEMWGRETPFAILAKAHRGLDDREAELAAVREWARRDSDAFDAALRWAELTSEMENWDEVSQAASTALAINPLIPAPHRYLAAASEKLANDTHLIAALQAQLELGPHDPAETHFRLAQALRRNGQSDRAKREVLHALEYAPRYRDAQRLLIEIVDEQKPTRSTEDPQ
jgi:tetratricopeptide (TPR) repeat protein